MSINVFKIISNFPGKQIVTIHPNAVFVGPVDDTAEGNGVSVVGTKEAVLSALDGGALSDILFGLSLRLR